MTTNTDTLEAHFTGVRYFRCGEAKLEIRRFEEPAEGDDCYRL